MFTKDYHATMFTTDTRVPSCPIYIAYVAPGEGQYHANSLSPDMYLHNDRPIAIIKATEFSDYTGTAFHRVNYQSLDESFSLIRIIGHQGYQALAYDATLGPIPDNEDLCDLLRDLERYGAIVID